MDNVAPYSVRRTSRNRHVRVRNLHYHLHEWGDASLATAALPPLVMMHGWMDVGASFQFVVDELERLEGARRYIVAADWRGFGGTASNGADTFWFADYLADLDGLLAALVPGSPVDLLGHSMGGNVVMSYAGVRPARIRRLINLEGFGMPDAPPRNAPARLARWLDELRSPPSLQSYATLEHVAERLRKTNPRLPVDKSLWLARHWSERRADERWHVLGEAAHKLVNPVPYRAEEVVAAWRGITAPVLWVEGARTTVWRRWGDTYSPGEFADRIAQVPRLEKVVLADCGHMVHHDRPAQLAESVKAFLDRG